MKYVVKCFIIICVEVSSIVIPLNIKNENDKFGIITGINLLRYKFLSNEPSSNPGISKNSNISAYFSNAGSLNIIKFASIIIKYFDISWIISSFFSISIISLFL